MFKEIEKALNTQFWVDRGDTSRRQFRETIPEKNYLKGGFNRFEKQKNLNLYFPVFVVHRSTSQYRLQSIKSASELPPTYSGINNLCRISPQNGGVDLRQLQNSAADLQQFNSIVANVFRNSPASKKYLNIMWKVIANQYPSLYVAFV